MACSTAHAMSMRSAGCGWAAVVACAFLLIESTPVRSQGQPPQAQVQPQPPAGQFVPQAQPPQSQSPQAQSPAAQVPPPPPAVEAPRKDNFFEAVGRWWDKSSADFKQSVDEQNAKWQELNAKNEKAAKDAAAASREAAEAFKNLSNVRMVEGRKVCEIAANGSPDCQAAAETLCRSKGFKTGNSADITTSRKCSIRGMLHRDASECKVETVMIKAACQ
jgi:type IV secretory pathway VirB10-like protein